MNCEGVGLVELMIVIARKMKKTDLAQWPLALETYVEYAREPAIESFSVLGSLINSHNQFTFDSSGNKPVPFAWSLHVREIAMPPTTKYFFFSRYKHETHKNVKS